jgi:type IV secretion system protein VirB1
MIGELAALAMACAPNVHPVTLDALVKHESRRQPYAIGVNGGTRLERQPRSREEAVALARTLMAQGVDFDAGLGQINVRNWGWLKLTAETVFEPCANLQAAQTVLTDCYSRAVKRHQAQQLALQAALSCYNTGNFERGFRNGYVGKVLTQAGIKIPALRSAPPAGNVPADNAQPIPERDPEPAPRGDRDGFISNPAPDGFSLPTEPSSPQKPESPVPPS